jgi:hypothetical protein
MATLKTDLHYFSALKKLQTSALDNVIPVPDNRRYPIENSVVFKHDIAADGLPADYESCDVIYSEPSWKKGMPIFNQAAQAHTNFAHYIKVIAEITKTINKPVFLTGGREVESVFNHADSITPITLNGDKARLFAFNTNFCVPTNTKAEEVIVMLAKAFNRVGDFCCGLGRTGVVFSAYDKSFVMSDINGKCIAAIVDKLTYQK